MIRSAFLSFYRSLTRHPLYAGLNILGLSFGVAVFIVLSLFVRFETSYEQWLPNADRIYVLGHQTLMMKSVGRPVSDTGPGYAFDAIRSAYPALPGTRVFPAYVTVHHGDVRAEETTQLVDPQFFTVFDLPVVAGDRDAALRAPDGLIVTETMARKYFGHTNVVGEVLFLGEDRYTGADPGLEQAWRIGAVVKDIPANSNLRVGLIRGLPAFRARYGLPDYWYRWGRSQLGRIYLVLPKEASPDAIATGIQSIIHTFPSDKHAPADLERQHKLRITLRSYAREHLSDRRLRQTLSALVVTALLSLLVALVNYANLAAARAGLRAREMVTRRVGGATGLTLAGQILGEAFLAGVLSLTVALSLVELCLPALNRVGGLSLQFDYSGDAVFLTTLAAVVLLACGAAGLGPASVLTGFQPARILGMSRTPGGSRFGRYVREAAIVVQFVSTCAFFIVIAGFAAQVRHVETSDLGFSRSRLLVTDSLPKTNNYVGKTKAVVDLWRRTSGIGGVANGQIPGLYYNVSEAPVRREARETITAVTQIIWISEDFFYVYGTAILAGRVVDETDDLVGLAPDFTIPLPDRHLSFNVDINLTAVHAFGFASAEAAVGQKLKYGYCTLHIVGVVADQRMQAPSEKNRPIFYGVWQPNTLFEDAVVRYSGIDEMAARERLKAEWMRIMPERPLNFTTMSQELDYYYRDDRRNTKLFAIGGGVAALIGAVGLFGLAAFSTSARVHEIGIRKSVGASHWHIIRLLMFQFLRPVLIANLIAWPVAYLVLDAWLKQFDDRVAMSPWFFLAGSGLSLLIAAVTVVGVAVSAAGLSPARALRQL